MRYHWQEKARIRTSVDSQAVGEWFERLRERYGKLTPDIVEKESERRSSPFHESLTWDNKKAGRLYRLKEVRTFMGKLRVSRNGTSVRAFAVVRNSAGEATYEPIDTVLRNHAYREQRIERAFRELQSFRERYAMFTELNSVLKLLEENAPEAVHA